MFTSADSAKWERIRQAQKFNPKTQEQKRIEAEARQAKYNELAHSTKIKHAKGKREHARLLAAQRQLRLAKA